MCRHFFKKMNGQTALEKTLPHPLAFYVQFDYEDSTGRQEQVLLQVLCPHGDCGGFLQQWSGSQNERIPSRSCPGSFQRQGRTVINCSIMVYRCISTSNHIGGSHSCWHLGLPKKYGAPPKKQHFMVYQCLSSYFPHWNWHLYRYRFAPQDSSPGPRAQELMGYRWMVFLDYFGTKVAPPKRERERERYIYI